MERKSQAEHAYEELKNILASRSLKAGTRMTEQTWVTRLGVNRGDVRQAFAQLYAEGLLEKGERGGYFVRRFSTEYLSEMEELRLILEAAAVRLAVQRATSEDIETLRSIAQHMRIMAENSYELGFGEADVRFHLSLVGAAHNSRLLHTYRQANILLSLNAQTAGDDRIADQAADTTAQEDKAAAQAKLISDAEDHAAIAECIARHDEKTALELLSRSFKG
jgi:DNA-binding GntR family transcriptional regulator